MQPSPVARSSAASEKEVSVLYLHGVESLPSSRPLVSPFPARGLAIVEPVQDGGFAIGADERGEIGIERNVVVGPEQLVEDAAFIDAPVQEMQPRPVQVVTVDRDDVRVSRP